MNKRYYVLVALIITALAFTSCNDITSQSDNLESIDRSADQVDMTSISEGLDAGWNIETLRDFLEVDSDSEVMFEAYYDFNKDGLNELIIAFGFDNDEERDYIDDIYYIGCENEKYEIFTHLEHSGYGYFAVELINLGDREEPVLYCKITNHANLEGFELYEVNNNSLSQILYSASAVGVGHDEMIDLDEDGVYHSYLQKRQSYDSLYTCLYKHYSYIDGEFVLDDISADFYNYPSTPEDVVRQYLNLHTLLNNEEMDIPDIDSRINDLCPKNFEPPYQYSMEDMINHSILLESPFMLRVETFEESNIVYVYQEHQTDETVPTVVYSLGKNDGKWQIYDFRVIGGDRIELSNKIDNYFHMIDYDDNVLLDKYKKVLMNELPILFEYVVANGSKSYLLENISFDGYWMKPIRFSLTDMNQDLVPELIVQGDLGAFGFTLIIREVEGGMIAHEFSHRQMHDLKSDGSFAASGGAAYSGYFYLDFDKHAYTINRIAETDTEEDEESNLKSIFYVGTTLTDEGEFWNFWNTLISKEPALWEHFKTKDDAKID